MRNNQYHCKMWKKMMKKCSFVRSYTEAAASSFTKYKTPSQIFYGLQ